MGRIGNAFSTLRNDGETALVPYLMAGYPSMDATRELLYAIVQAGADAVEFGVPFSDPLADGATLQRANHRALSDGVTLRSVLDLVASVRRSVTVPLVLMTYVNPIFRIGVQEFAADASAAGVDGLVVPDLPVEEAGPLREACGSLGIDMIGMVAPTSPDHRVGKIARAASGFVYCVSLRGTTGARSGLSSEAAPLVERVRSKTDLPAVVGFGISTPEHVRAVTAFADGAIVASALVDRIDTANGKAAEAAGQFVRELKAGCRTKLKV